MEILLVSAQTPTAERSLMNRIVAEYGVGLLEAVTYKKALEVLARDRHAIVILYSFNAAGDISVADALRIMKQIVPELLIVAVSDEESFESERELRRSGLYYYLTRPFTDGELLEALSGAIETQARRKTR